MAHRGRPYPVDFRRDYNQNCDVSIPRPNAARYRVVIHSGVVPTYPIDGTVFVPERAVYIPVNLLKWTSARVTVGGFQWWVEIDQIFPFLPDTKRTALLTLFRSDRSNVASWAYRAPSYDDPLQFISTEANTSGLDPFVFPRGGSFQNSTTTPIGY